MYIMDYDFRPEKGQNFEIEIEDMSGEGAGIGRVNGLTVFVNGAVYKDVVSCEITKLKKNYCFAKLKAFTRSTPSSCSKREATTRDSEREKAPSLQRRRRRPDNSCAISNFIEFLLSAFA